MALWFGQLLLLEELERREARRAARGLRRMLRDRQNPFELAESEFMKHFRLSKEACRYLCEQIHPHMEEGRYQSRVPKVFRVLPALNFFATGSYQRSVARNVLACCSQSVVSRSIKEVANVIVRNLLKQWVRFPRTNEENHRMKDSFHQRHRMPNVTGVVDGTHVAIVKPLEENENIYVNRKGYHSLNCQIICDTHLRITNVVAGRPGSTDDAYLWRQSRIGQIMRSNYLNGDNETLIMGDSGYSCSPWLLIPLATPQTEQQQQFNDTFKRCRSLVERCIGVLKGRFRCLLIDRPLHYTPRAAARIIVTCVVLHNIAIHYRVQDPAPRWDEIDVEVPIDQYAHADIVYGQLGQQRRLAYIAAHF